MNRTTHALLLILTLITPCAFAESYRVFLGEFDVVGPQPSRQPLAAKDLILEIREPVTVTCEDRIVGYIPGPFQQPVRSMIAKGLTLHLEPTHWYPLPRNGRILRVALWADTPDLSLIEPLIYSIPIHTQEDLEDYE